MAIERIDKDMNAVKVQAAEARGERLDSEVKKNIDTMTKDLVSDMSPQNLHLISELVKFSVDELTRPQFNVFQQIADAKQVPLGAKPAFKVPMNGIKAFIQAKGATTPKSKVATKQVLLDTVAISVRPVLNKIEMITGQAQMSDLVRYAAQELQDKKSAYIYSVLTAGVSSWASPFYGTGAGGIVAATLNPMVQHWIRSGGATIVGDIAMISKLAAETGFTAATNTKEYAHDIIVEQNNNGFVGRYNGADVVQLANPYTFDGVTPVLGTTELFIIPKGISPDMRPLKVIEEGGVESMEATHIDDLSYEIRMDQYFGAGVVIGEHPYMSIYKETTL